MRSRNSKSTDVAVFDIPKFMGDGVLCYFGWPQANEDDAGRAVRAGLAIISGVKLVSGPDGELGRTTKARTILKLVHGSIAEGNCAEDSARARVFTGEGV